MYDRATADFEEQRNPDGRIGANLRCWIQANLAAIGFRSFVQTLKISAERDDF